MALERNKFLDTAHQRLREQVEFLTRQSVAIGMDLEANIACLNKVKANVEQLIEYYDDLVTKNRGFQKQVSAERSKKAKNILEKILDES